MDNGFGRRVRRRAYENKNIIVRRGKRRYLPFFLFLALFGGVVYLVAAALFHSITVGQWVTAFFAV